MLQAKRVSPICRLGPLSQFEWLADFIEPSAANLGDVTMPLGSVAPVSQKRVNLPSPPERWRPHLGEGAQVDRGPAMMSDYTTISAAFPARTQWDWPNDDLG